MHHQHAIAGLCPSHRSERDRERERERGMQARMKEARKSGLEENLLTIPTVGSDLLTCTFTRGFSYMTLQKKKPVM